MQDQLTFFVIENSTLTVTTPALMSMDDDDLRAITSFRWPLGSDIPLQKHQARLLATATALGWKDAAASLSSADAVLQMDKLLEVHLSADSKDREREHKFTLDVSRDGSMSLSSSPLSGPLHNFLLLPPGVDDATTIVDVYISPHATVSSLFTKHKTSLRQHYNDARAAVSLHLPPTSAEVLLWNEEDEITEASLCTVYIQRNNTWITPRAASGCNMGLSRDLALVKGWCREGMVTKSELQHGETIKLSNCVRGFWSGRIVLRE